MYLKGTLNDPVIAAGTNASIGSLRTDGTWTATDTLTVKGSLVIQGDGQAGHGQPTSIWDGGTIDLSGGAPPPPGGGGGLVATATPYLEVTGGHQMAFWAGKITSDQSLGSVYVDGNLNTTQSQIAFARSFSDITANVFIGKTPGGLETHQGAVTFSSSLNGAVNLHGASTITVNDKGSLNLSNSTTGSLGGIQFPAGEANVTAHIDLLENGTVTVTAPNAQPMPLPSITQENGTLEVNGKATINVGNGQPANTPGLQLSGGILQLDPGSYVTSDLKATGSGVWWNPSPATGTATTVLAGAVTWSSSGYISVGDMGNDLGRFTNWVQLQCNQFNMYAGTLNIGVGTNPNDGTATGDWVLVQGSVNLNNSQQPGDPNNANLAVYAMAQPPCQDINSSFTCLKATNSGTLTGSFASVGPYAGSPWDPATIGKAWKQDEATTGTQVRIYYS